MRARLNEWARKPEWSLLIDYELPQKPTARWCRRIRQRGEQMLRILRFDCSRYLNQPWQAGLKHVDHVPEARPLLMWGEGYEREFVREACEGAKRSLQAHPEFVPVLVTDVADFVFFSRLGWLVEYLPRLSREGDSYRDRKRRHLAWCYRHALAIPLSAGLGSRAEWDELLRSGGR
ncbi:MAG: hypothetical protein LBD06_00405 [Candidatus Accumulibacter sp.]|nr:hypothetical protein [Accumulibacter sp.]